MRPKVVAVVPLSQSNSNPCWKCGKIPEKAILCNYCHALLDIPTPLPSSFEIFGLPESLKLDETKLRETYYQLSKQTHPDRFVTRPHPEPAYALRWNTAVNRAYKTLKDPVERAYLLLEKYPAQVAAKNQVPLDLAETYFELQDILLEGNGNSILPFKNKLQQELKQVNTDWDTLETRWEKESDKTHLANDLRTHLNKAKYLNSMLADLERKFPS